MDNILYVVCVVDKNYDFVRYAVGGGSSTKPSIKAHDNEKSANRSMASSPDRHRLNPGEQLMVLPYKETII